MNFVVHLISAILLVIPQDAITCTIAQKKRTIGEINRICIDCNVLINEVLRRFLILHPLHNGSLLA